MANEEQVNLLRQDVRAWNEWRIQNSYEEIDLGGANLGKVDLYGANLTRANLLEANLSEARLLRADLRESLLRDANLDRANLNEANLSHANLKGTTLTEADLTDANLDGADLRKSDFTTARLFGTTFRRVQLFNTCFFEAEMGGTTLSFINLHHIVDLDTVHHVFPSSVGLETIRGCAGDVSDVFLRGCGLSDWEIESAKLYYPELNNEEINRILYRIYDLRAEQALQISPLFISYSHADSMFVDKVEHYLNKKGVRFWRDIHDMRSGRMEKQIDRAMRLNPTVLLVLSNASLQSDWVEHEVRTARSLEKELKRDILCPVALDDGWKNSSWAKRIMEQILEYNILDFSEWKDDSKFENVFGKLIEGLNLFYG